MKAPPKLSASPKALRARAEQLLDTTERDVAQMPVDDVQKLVHELQVHQIELKMQNEALRKTQLELETVRDRYANLYDFAPSALLTLDAHGQILEANLSAGKLLGLEHRRLLGQKFTRFIAAESQDTCYLLCRKVFNSDARQSVELQLVNAQARRLSVEFVAVRDPHSRRQQCQVSFTDITERKLMEAALIASERRFRSIYHHAATGIAITSLDGQFVQCNPAYCRIAGRREAELCAMKFSSLIHPEDLRENLELMRRLLGGEIPSFGIENRYLGKNGEVVWVHQFVSLLREEQGGGTHMVALVTDITERKQAEQALGESQARFRQMTEAIDQVFWMTSVDKNQMLYISPAYEKIWQRTCQSLYDSPQNWLAPVHPEDRPRLLKAATTKQATGEYDEEYRILRPDGMERWIHDRAFPVPDASGKIIGIAGVADDITERKRAEEALRRSEHHLANFFQQAPIGLVWLSAIGTILRANLAQLDLLGYTQADYVGQFFNKFCEDPAQGLELLERLANRETIHNFPMTRRRRDGAIRHVLVDAHPLWNEEKFQYSSVFLRDITDRRELEREILQVSEREHRRIAQDLHDGLGQLLVGTAYLTSSLRDQLVAKGLAESRELGRILDVVYEAIAQTRQLARGIHPVEPEPNGLMVALQGLADRTKMLFKIPCRFTCRRPVMIADNVIATHLFRIAQEAITNAIKHGHPGRIQIRLSTAADRITLAIQDDGAGLPARPRKKSGMGLRIMRYRAVMIGGTVTIESPSGSGTIVACTAPLSSAGGGNPPAPAPAARRKK